MALSDGLRRSILFSICRVTSTGDSSAVRKAFDNCMTDILSMSVSCLVGHMAPSSIKTKKLGCACQFRHYAGVLPVKVQQRIGVGIHPNFSNACSNDTMGFGHHPLVDFAHEVGHAIL